MRSLRTRLRAAPTTVVYHLPLSRLRAVLAHQKSMKTRIGRAVEYSIGRSHYGHGVNLRELQDVIDATYGERDRERGVAPTVAWLCEELGELAQAVRKGTPDQVEHEFSDVLAWIATLANQVGVDLTEVVDRYRDGCPKCSALPCAC